jgi:hypothetical protein
VGKKVIVIQEIKIQMEFIAVEFNNTHNLVISSGLFLLLSEHPNVSSQETNDLLMERMKSNLGLTSRDKRT